MRCMQHTYSRRKPRASFVQMVKVLPSQTCQCSHFAIYNSVIPSDQCIHALQVFIWVGNTKYRKISQWNGDDRKQSNKKWINKIIGSMKRMTERERERHWIEEAISTKRHTSGKPKLPGMWNFLFSVVVRSTFVHIFDWICHCFVWQYLYFLFCSRGAYTNNAIKLNDTGRKHTKYSTVPCLLIPIRRV